MVFVAGTLNIPSLSRIAGWVTEDIDSGHRTVTSHHRASTYSPTPRYILLCMFTTVQITKRHHTGSLLATMSSGVKN
jgi:hypothetical protein